jgi:hypothetical protein
MAIFLTTAALQIYLLWRDSPLSQAIAATPTSEVWISPLSHAILEDTFHTSETLDDAVKRRGLRAVRQHRQIMKGAPTYPYPNSEAVRIWTEIRSLQVDIPAYDDTIATYPAQHVGPDELLVFATAAALPVPLFGPAPIDAETVEYLKDVGVVCSSL